jgi:hypothetical protein
MLRICNRVNNDTVKICNNDWQIIPMSWTLASVWSIFNIADTLGVSSVPAFRLLLLCWQILCYFTLRLVAWVGMKHWPFQYTTHFIPQLKTMILTSRRKRFVEFSQQQQTTFGYRWHRTKFITGQAMDLKLSEGFRPLHWFVLHRQAYLHTFPVHKETVILV